MELGSELPSEPIWLLPPATVEVLFIVEVTLKLPEFEPRSEVAITCVLFETEVIAVEFPAVEFEENVATPVMPSLIHSSLPSLLVGLEVMALVVVIEGISRLTIVVVLVSVVVTMTTDGLPGTGGALVVTPKEG